MKALEGEHAHAPFTRQTLADYGPFFQETGKLVNCSIGEPFMMKSLDGILDAFGEQGKTVEMSTNGQILTDRNIEKLLGRDIHLYVSLDAATPETYERLRNTRFLRILDNLRRLVAAKRGRGGLPFLYLVFMPMRVNAHELGAFVRLSAEIGADQLILRPLDPGEGIGLRWDRGGYRFDYQRENLSFQELMRLSGKAHELCRHLGVPLSSQLDFGGQTEQRFRELFDQGVREAREEIGGDGGEGDEEGEEADGTDDVGGDEVGEEVPPHSSLGKKESLGKEKWPICTEPWRSLYVLRRGTLPCCYGGRPIAGPEGFQGAWNGPLLQAIRRDLAAGRFHSYCVRTRSCPIVQKSEAARELGKLSRVYRRVLRVFHRLDRLSGGRLLTAAKGLERLAEHTRSAFIGASAEIELDDGSQGEGDHNP
jgi:hypothetical protein